MRALKIMKLFYERRRAYRHTASREALACPPPPGIAHKPARARRKAHHRTDTSQLANATLLPSIHPASTRSVFVLVILVFFILLLEVLVFLILPKSRER